MSNVVDFLHIKNGLLEIVHFSYAFLASFQNLLTLQLIDIENCQAAMQIK